MSNNKASYPFYVHPMGYKRSIQIIKETKAEIKKMESQRPSTPFGRKKIDKDYCLPTTSRPSSSSSVKSLKYEHEEDCCLSSRKLQPLFSGSIKGKSTNPNDMKLEPLVTKSILTTRKSINSLVKSQSQQDVTFPPIPYDEKIKSVENSIRHEVSLQNIDRFLVDCHNNIISADGDNLNKEIEKLDYANSLDGEPIGKLNNEDSNTNELSQEIKHIMFILDKNLKLGARKCEEDHIATLSKLYKLLKEKNALQVMHYHRVPLLKLLFGLLDSNFPDQSLYTIRLLLDMKVNDRNLGTIFRLMLKLITYKQVNLEEYELTETLIETVQEISFQNNKESLLYGVNILKSLVFRNAIKEQYLQKCVVTLMHHLSQFNDMMPSPEERCDDTYIDLNKQIFVTLHYLVENEEVWKMLSKTDNLSEILKGLGFFYQNTEVIQIIVRLISKIIDGEEKCQYLAQCPEKLIMGFVLILQTHRYNIDIAMQTAFIIGNYLIVDKKIAETFLNVYTLHDILIKILEDYVKEHVQPRRTLSELFKLGQGVSSSGDHDWRHDIFEVISRVLCVLANICLNDAAGSILAQENDTITHLLNIIGVYLKQDTLSDISLPVYSFLVVIGNISYYLSADSDNSLRIAKRIMPLLDDKYSLEVRRESANIVQNLTRCPQVRKYIEDYSLIPAFIKLLSEDDKEFNIVAYGIIMNLLLDRNNHQIFYEEQGVTRILHKLHMCTERDWKTSSLLCQILWNYCKCLKEDDIPISKMEVQHLIKYLSYSTDKDKNPDDESSESYFIWMNQFCPVAKKLLILLQSKNSSTA